MSRKPNHAVHIKLVDNIHFSYSVLFFERPETTLPTNATGTPVQPDTRTLNSELFRGAYGYNCMHYVLAEYMPQGATGGSMYTTFPCSFSFMYPVSI